MTAETPGGGGLTEARKGRLLEALDHAVEYGILTRDEAFAVLDAVDSAAAGVQARAEGRATNDLIHADITALLLTLGLSDHARTYSMHEVVQRDILPAIHALRDPQ